MTVLLSFLVYAAAHHLSNFVRTANAVLASDLARDVGLGPADLGVMTGAYFLAFAAAQLPIGMALDRFGPRRTTGSLLVIAVVGAAAFALGESLAALTAARVALGIGTAGVLMGGLKALSERTDPARFAAWSGAMLAVGTSGAMTAAGPLAWASEAFGWRSAFYVCAALLALAAAAIAVYGGGRSERRGGPAEADARAAATGFREVFASPRFHRAAFVATVATGATFAYQGLWAGPYLEQVTGLATREVGTVLTAYSSGIVVGYLVLGQVAQRLGPVRTLAVCLAAAVVLQLWLASAPSPGAGRLTAGFAAFGFAGASSALLFAWVRAAFPTEATGRAVTAINLFMFGGGFLMQVAMGAGLQWTGASPAWLFAATALTATVAVLVLLPDARREASLSSRARR